MRTHCITIDLANQGRRQVRARFDGGRMSSDGGTLLLQAVDQRIGLTRRLAACFVDHRNPRRCEHSLQRLLAQRLFGLALGYEDLCDHDRDHPLADPQRPDALLVELFLDSHAAAPEEIVLDVDATDDPLHGRQEGRFFHGYNDCYCYLPLYVTCGPHLLCGRLRRSNRDAADGAVEELQRIVGQIRQRWPRVRVAGDAGFCRDELMAWCKAAEGGGWWARRSGCRAGCTGTTSASW